MPKRDDPRVVVRLAPEDHEMLSALAKAANVSLGGLMRETAVKFAASVARDASRGDIQIRRDHAVEAVKGQVVPARSLVVESEHARVMRERQERVNALGKSKPPVRRRVP